MLPTCHVTSRCAWCCLELSVLEVWLTSRRHQAVSKRHQGVLGAVTRVGLMLVLALQVEAAAGHGVVKGRGLLSRAARGAMAGVPTRCGCVATG